MGKTVDSKKVDLEERVIVIENRNKRVELDKAWEQSVTRKITIAILTYLTIYAFMKVGDFPKPALSSIVPVAGYL